MTDIAQLGISVDSRSATVAVAALDRLTAAANRAGPAAGHLEQAAGAAGAALDSAARSSSALISGVGGIERAGRPAAQSIQRMSFEARNLGFQLVDVTQGLLSGQSAMMIFAQQAGQIAQIVATSP